jgi:hypothetical protein
MGPTEIHGLPAHALLVHVVVVLVPVAAIMVICSAAWPAARARLGIGTPIAALLALIAVPITTHAGEWLEERVAPTPLVKRHADLGDTLLPWVIAMFVLSAALWALRRYQPGAGSEASVYPVDDYPVDEPVTVGAPGGAPAPAPAPRRARRAASAATATRPAPGGLRVVAVVLAVLSIAAAVGSITQVYRIGESGAKAVWSGSYSQNPRPGS